jgi:hypothetical protein
MIIVLSPSKSIDFKENEVRKDATLPLFDVAIHFRISITSEYFISTYGLSLEML